MSRGWGQDRAERDKEQRSLCSYCHLAANQRNQGQVLGQETQVHCSPIPLGNAAAGVSFLVHNTGKEIIWRHDALRNTLNQILY